MFPFDVPIRRPWVECGEIGHASLRDASGDTSTTVPESIEYRYSRTVGTFQVSKTVQVHPTRAVTISPLTPVTRRPPHPPRNGNAFRGAQPM